MMKIIKKCLILTILIGLFSPMFAVPTEAARQNTLGYYEEKLAQYKKEAEENRKAINKTESEINYSRSQINKLKQEALDLTEEVNRLTDEIDSYNNKIKDKLLESKQLLEYLQLSGGKNVYLDYVFKAESVTDFINRSYTVKEIINYNTKTVNELEQMIKDNEKREEEIEKRKIAINQKEIDLEKNIVTLGEAKESLTAGGIDTDKQIKIYEDQVAMYKKQGCKTNDVIGVDCAVQGGTGVFRRPTKTGYVTQEAYFTSTSKFHRALDIGSKNGRGEKIYPIADGVITSIYTDSYGALCLTIQHYNINDGKTYTSLYVHMSSYAPGLKEGNKITSEQYIGYMGDTGKAYGVHLHLEVYPCKLNDPTDRNCYKWSVYNAYAQSLLKQGYTPRKLISFPSGTYNSWNTR